MPIRVYYEVLNQKGSPAVYADNYAQRPAAGFTGRIFYSPDTAQIFYDTGTTWTLLADAGVGSGSLASVCANGNTTATGIIITAGGLSTNSITNTSNTAGSVLFAGTGGAESQSNATFFWDNTNKRLGLGNNAPGVTLDIHGTGTLVQLNGTGANNAFLQFQNAGVSKWRIGNLYNAGNNDFQIYNSSLGAAALTINLSASSATFAGGVSAGRFISTSGINLVNGSVVSATGQTGIGGLTNGLTIALDSTITQQLLFPTGVAYQYTFPSATGTIALTSNLSSYLPLAGGTLTGQLTISNASTPQLQVTHSGSGTATIYVTGTSGYSTILWTGGAGGGYGQMSYNLSGNYMQYGTNGSEFMRMFSNGNLRVFTSSATDNGKKFQVEGTSSFSSDAVFSSYLTLSNKQFTIDTGVSNDAGIFIKSTGSSGTGNAQIQAFNSGIGYNCPLFLNPNGGRVGINTSSPSFPLDVNGEIRTSSSTAAYSYNDRGSGAVYTMYGNSSNTNFYNLGIVSTISMATGIYTPVSDFNKKKDFEDNIIGLNEILQIKTFTYRMKTDDNNAPKQLGFIAQQVKEFIPYAYVENEEFIGLNDRPIIAGLVKAVQELNQKIENLN